MNTGKRGTKRFLFGNEPKEESSINDDVEVFGDKNVDHFITKISVYVKDEKIIGIAASYFCNVEIMEG